MKNVLFLALLLLATATQAQDSTKNAKKTTKIANETWGSRYEEGKMYLKNKESGKAILVFETVKTQTEKEVGKNHQYYAIVLNDLALAYEMNKQLPKAKELYLEILGIKEKLVGKEHQSYATTLSDLAIVQFGLGDLDSAESNSVKALEIYKKTLGEKSGEYAQVASNLVFLRKQKSKK